MKVAYELAELFWLGLVAWICFWPRSAIPSDLTGAREFGIDCLFVTRGIHAEEFEGLDQLDPKSVTELFGHPPKALMCELKW